MLWRNSQAGRPDTAPLVLCLLVVVCLTTIAPAQRRLRRKIWSSNFEKAETLARQQKLPLLIHFYADWCGPCKKMERETLNSPELARWLHGRIIAVKVNSDERLDLVERFGVESLPADIFVAPSGNVIQKSSGYQQKRTYLANVSRIARHPSKSKSRLNLTGGSQPKNETSNEDVEGPTARPHRQKSIVGLEGFSPVALAERRLWERGDPRFSAEYQDIVYHMRTPDELARFRANSAKYAPRLLGCDPVILWRTDRAVSGRIQFTGYFQNELFLFASEATRREFRQNARRYARARHVLHVDEIRPRQSKHAESEALTRTN